LFRDGSSSDAECIDAGEFLFAIDRYQFLAFANLPSPAISARASSNPREILLTGGMCRRPLERFPPGQVVTLHRH
jgi:hypothetical protein